MSPVELPALRADVSAPTAVKTPVLYPACVVACFISLISAQKGEKSLISPFLLFPPNPLCWASAGALNRPRKLLKSGPISGGFPRSTASEKADTAAHSGRHVACSQVYDDGKRRRSLQEFFCPPFDFFDVHWCFRIQCFTYQSCIHGIGDLFAPCCVCPFTLTQSAPVFIREVHSELIDVAERCIEDGVPELFDVLQIRTCAFEMEHRITVDQTADDVKLQSDHRLPWIPLSDGTLRHSSLPVSALFESPRYAGV